MDIPKHIELLTLRLREPVVLGAPLAPASNAASIARPSAATALAKNWSEF
jgi:hypothetical protein